MHRQAPGQEHEFNGFSSRLPFILFLCSFYSLFGPCHNPNPYQQKPVSAPTEPEHQARRCVQAGVRRKAVGCCSAAATNSSPNFTKKNPEKKWKTPKGHVQIPASPRALRQPLPAFYPKTREPRSASPTLPPPRQATDALHIPGGFPPVQGQRGAVEQRRKRLYFIK